MQAVSKNRSKRIFPFNSTESSRSSQVFEGVVRDSTGWKSLEFATISMEKKPKVGFSVGSIRTTLTLREQ